jgi:hypothetical protein
MKNLGHFVTFYMNLHTRSQAYKLGLRLHQKVAAPTAPAPQHCQYLHLKDELSTVPSGPWLTTPHQT